MPYITVGTQSQLSINIPTKSTLDWSETLRTQCWIPISLHNHSGTSGQGVQLTSAALAPGSVTEAQILLDNNSYVLGENFVGSGTINILKVNALNTITLGTTLTVPVIGDPTDPTKTLTLALSGATTASQLTLSSNHTTARTWTIQDTTDTFVGRATTDTLTNKTLTSPTLTTPTLGVATATSINKVTITAPASGATLTLANGSSLITAGAYAITLTATNTTGVTLPTTGTLSTLAGSETLTNKTITTPTITLPLIGDTTDSTKNIAFLLSGATTGKTLTISSSQTVARTWTIQDTTDTFVGRATTDTLTNKTLTSPTLTTPALGVATATSINKVTITAPSTGSTLTLADGSTLATSGAYSATFTFTGATSVTFPTSGTLVTSSSAISATAFTAKGDILVGTGSATYTNLAVGANTQALIADSTQTSGTKWATISSSYEILNGSLAMSASAGALTIALKDNAGSDPSATSAVKIGFRNSTVTTGTYTEVAVTAALSTVISSGSTAGFSSSGTYWLNVYLINNSGTAELAWSQASADLRTVVSTTAEGGSGGATSGTTIYSTSARSNVPAVLLGYAKFTLTTAGTWLAPVLLTLNKPGSIAGNETIAARFENQAGTSVSTDAYIPYTTVIFDTHNASSGSGTSWVYTIPAPGRYCVDLAIYVASATWAAGNAITGELWISGSLDSRLCQKVVDATTTSAQAATGSKLVNLTAGATIAVKITSSQSTTLNTTAGYNTLCIHRIGF